MNEKLVLTVKEAAEMLCISVKTCYDLTIGRISQLLKLGAERLFPVKVCGNGYEIRNKIERRQYNEKRNYIQC